MKGEGIDKHSADHGETCENSLSLTHTSTHSDVRVRALSLRERDN